MFDRSVVISLPRRPDRLEEFRRRVAAAWPGLTVEHYPAFDGREHKPPCWWATTPGAWGCARSHAAVIDEAIEDGAESLLVFEDDATFAPGFLAALARLEIPEDTQQLYLGGEHLEPPEPVAAGVVRATNTNRTHAYALFGRGTLQMVAYHLRPDPAVWTGRHHVDHHYGLLHKARTINAYAVTPWLCGQAAGKSDIDGRTRPERSW